MKTKSIEPVFSFENPNTPTAFENMLKQLLMERLLALYSQTHQGEATNK